MRDLNYCTRTIKFCFACCLLFAILFLIICQKSDELIRSVASSQNILMNCQTIFGFFLASLIDMICWSSDRFIVKIGKQKFFLSHFISHFFFFLQTRKVLATLTKKRKMRCANCTQGISQDFSGVIDRKCVVCGDVVNQCPICADVSTNTCSIHTPRKHICISKCQNECILKRTKTGPKKKHFIK